MFGKKKKKRVNTFKTESNERKATVKKSSDNSKRSSFKKLLHPLHTFLENDRNRYITGLTFLSISFFLTFSFVSYFFSWKIDQDKILVRKEYEHPYYNREMLESQKRHSEISGKNRTHYAGAYWGNGFHEDGVKSGLRTCKEIEAMEC